MENSLKKYKYYLIALALLGCTLIYYNYTGKRIFSSGMEKGFVRSGPGYHK